MLGYLANGESKIWLPRDSSYFQEAVAKVKTGEFYEYYGIEIDIELAKGDNEEIDIVLSE